MHTRNPFDLQKWGCVRVRVRALVYKHPAGAFSSEGRLLGVSLFFPSVFHSGSDSSLYYYYHTHAVVASQPVPHHCDDRRIIACIHNMII